MRKGDSLKEASKKYGSTIKQAKIYLGKSIYKKNKKWFAKSKDRLEREMLIYEENIGKVIVIINQFKYAQLIGEYFSIVKIALNSGDDSKLIKFQNTPVIDSINEIHYLETNLNRIYEYEDKIENSEFFDIYGD